MSATDFKARNRELVLGYLSRQDMTFAELARRFGITRERVRQILKAAGIAKHPSTRRIRACSICNVDVPNVDASSTCSAACADVLREQQWEANRRRARARGARLRAKHPQIAALRKKGLPLVAIAEAVGLSLSTVQVHLRRAGLEYFGLTRPLSPRRLARKKKIERIVARAKALIASGLSRREVAARLKVSKSTVATYITTPAPRGSRR